MASRTAVIDIGSNSIRLAVYEKSSRYAFSLIYESKARVRLSESFYENDNSITSIALKNAIDVLTDFQKIIKKLKARKTLCVATSVLRDAKNAKAFIKTIKDKTSIKIKVIDGDVEAKLGSIAVINLLPKNDSITIDIGGGSTDISLIENSKVVKLISLNLGTVRLKELYLDKDNIDGAKELIKSEIKKLDLPKNLLLVGIGGTFRALSQSIQKNSNYKLDKIHAFSFKTSSMSNICKNITDASSDDELYNLGIKKDRFDVIRGGALILNTFIEEFESLECMCSGVGIREGVFLSDLLRTNNSLLPHNFNTSLRFLKDKYLDDKNDTTLRVNLANKLLELSSKSIDIELKKIFLDSIALGRIGESISFRSSSNHAYYLIKNSLDYAYTHKQIMSIATLVKYQSKKSISNEHYKKYIDILIDKEILDYFLDLHKMVNALTQTSIKMPNFDIVYKDGIFNIKLEKDSYLIKSDLANIKICSF